MTRSRVVTHPRGVNTAAITRRDQIRALAGDIVDQIVATKGDDARDRRIDLVATYLTSLIESAANGAIARLAAMAEDERAAIFERMREATAP